MFYFWNFYPQSSLVVESYVVHFSTVSSNFSKVASLTVEQTFDVHSQVLCSKFVKILIKYTVVVSYFSKVSSKVSKVSSRTVEPTFEKCTHRVISTVASQDMETGR